jgi:hypothetical protein
MNINSVPRFQPADNRKPQPGQPVDRHDLATALHSRAARQRLIEWLDTELAHDTLLHRQNWPLGAAALGVTATVVLTLWTLGAFVTGLVSAANAGGRHTGTWLFGDSVIRTATSAITAWLDAHAAGLPATSAELGMAWLGIAGVLYVVALTGSTFARIAWTLIGAATIAATYAGAAAAGAAAAAATTAAVWLLLSLPVYRRRTRRRPAVDTAS